MNDRTRERLSEAMIWNALPPLTSPTTKLVFPRFLERMYTWLRK